MTETETAVQTDPQAGIDEIMAQAMAESAAQAASTADSVASAVPPAPAESGKVEVIQMGPTIVEPAAPKEINLPDTPEIRRILQVEVPIIVRLADKIMPLGEIMQLQPGAIIEFNKIIGADLDLMINNKCIGGGQAVKVGEKFGLKVTKITTLDKMILAMGGK